MTIIEAQNSDGGVSLEQAQEMLEGFSAVNLDEVSPASVTVAFREFVADAQKGYAVKIVKKDIHTWVPMYLFNRMLANQKRVQKLRSQARNAAPAIEAEESFDLFADEEPFNPATLSDEAFQQIMRESEPAIVWQSREVLTIWKLTPGEEHMSLKRLVLGLGFEQIQGLFMRFFGAMLRQKGIRA